MSRRNTQLLIEAAQTGNVDELRRLIPLSDPKSNNSSALRWAAANGHTECVELLIPVSNPKDKGKLALCLAVEFGHTACVALLIPVSDPKDNDSWALQVAVANGHTQCVELLYPVSDPVVALNGLKEDFSKKPEKWSELEARVEADRLKNTLNAAIGEPTEHPTQMNAPRKI